MFSFCSALESIDVSGFNTANVESMALMFEYLSLKVLDVSGFNTQKLKNTSYMFNQSRSLTTIYCDETWQPEDSSNMFTGCQALVGGKGTAFDSSHTNGAYARPDGGPSNPGYFTVKPAFVRGDVNGDGQVTIADVTALVNIILGKSEAPASGVADVNTDGSITIADVTALVNIILGK